MRTVQLTRAPKMLTRKRTRQQAEATTAERRPEKEETAPTAAVSDGRTSHWQPFVGTEIIMIAWIGNTTDGEDVPATTKFHGEASFRDWALQQSLGNQLDQCCVMAKAFRRMEAVMKEGKMKPAQARRMSQEERHFLQDLLAQPLCCDKAAEDRWYDWYFKQPHVHWSNPPLILPDLKDSVRCIEGLMEENTPLGTVLRDMQTLMRMCKNRKFHFLVTQRTSVDSEEWVSVVV